jgi:hypothetical protein
MHIPLMLSAMIALNSCVLLPIPTAERKVLAGQPVTEKQLDFLAPNVTTKKEVIDRIGRPNVIWEEANLFAYNWEMRSGILIWAFAGQMVSAAGMQDISKRYALLIQFDEQDRVLRFEKVVRPQFKAYGDFLREWVNGSHSSSPPAPSLRKE